MSDAPEEANQTAGKATSAFPSSMSEAQDLQVDRRNVALQRLVSWLVTAVVSMVTMIGLLIAGIATRPSLMVTLSGLALWIVVCATLATSSHFWPAIEHRHLSYRLSEEGIQIRRGVLWREVITVPRNRIQHTDVSQGPLERRFGLATLLVHTAGTEFARVTLGGLENDRALAIRDHLMAGGEDHAL